MKKSLILSVMAIACSFAFAGCTKEVSPETEGPHVVTFTINANAPETKTYIVYDSGAKTYTPNWNNGDKLGVFFDSWADSDPVQATFENTLANGATASFSWKGTVSSSEQVIYAFYPAGKFAKAYDNHVLGITIPEVQKPTATSFDKDADILVNKPYPITISNSSVVINDMQFSRVLSTLKLVVADGTGGGTLSSDTIKSITLTTDDSDVALTGRYQWDFENESGSMNSNVKANHVTADLKANPVVLNGTSPIYFLINPTTLASGSNLVINISTDQHEITKTAPLPKAFEFPAGKVANLSITIKDTDTIEDAITEPTGTGWFLVQDTDWLKSGDKVIITNAGSNKALYSQTTNNWSSTNVSVSEGKLVPGSAAQFTLADGNETGTFAFLTGSSYLVLKSDNNYLHSDASSITDASSWVITANKTGTTIFNVERDNREIQFNSGSGSGVFACYKSTQQAVRIYKEYTATDTRKNVSLSFSPANPDAIDLGDSFTAPTLTVDPTAASSSVVYSVSSVPANCATIVENTGELTISAAGVITVTASIPNDDTEYKPVSASYSLTVIDPNVVDYVTLPWSYPEGDNSATQSGILAETGVSADGLGDYAEQNAPYQIKLDNTGDFFLIKTDSAIDKVSIKYKMIGGGNTSSLTIEESNNGTDWSNVQELSIAGSQNSIGVLTTSNHFDEGSCYVKITFTKGSNVGIGGIAITKASNDPVINAADINVTALGATNSEASYTISHFTGSGDVSVKEFTGCVTAASIVGGKIQYSVDPNYGTDAQTGTIVLESSEAPDKTINVTQSGDTFSQSGADGDPLVLTIGADANTATFTVTSAVFGYNASAVPASGMNLTITGGDSGSASASAQTITVNSTTAAPSSGDPLTLGTVVVYRNANTDDAQKITIIIKKAVSGADSIVYTLTPASGSNNSYTGNCDITIAGITWNLAGNSQQIPWRIGGKSLNGVDRALYSKTALNKNISKIEITHGAASSITINSMTVIVATDASFSNVVSTLTPTFSANSTITVKRPDGQDWSDCYYKIVYNITVSGNSNRFIEFTRAEFTGK